MNTSDGREILNASSAAPFEGNNCNCNCNFGKGIVFDCIAL